MREGSNEKALSARLADGRLGNDNAQLHRIQSSAVEAVAIKAGYLVDGSSELLRNPDDPLNVGVSCAGKR